MARPKRVPRSSLFSLATNSQKATQFSENKNILSQMDPQKKWNLWTFVEFVTQVDPQKNYFSGKVLPYLYLLATVLRVP
jgi:hypothetical protein